ncbi:MAG: hypothetical protein COT00_01925 [Candidatus Omnitrophica bacterium CG07_land_8_20_14_0_80_50_8]|nr:MAG: hypothetical protein COT00_01925 [Candidatus Omnitrophica bacterium CG07_land_8_20_14_0_80_50_8]
MAEQGERLLNICHRPWGHYEILRKGTGFEVKLLELDPSLRFSLQKHFRRSEKWIVVSGEGIVELGQQKISIKKGSFIDVPIGEIHRVYNTGKVPLVIIEVQIGDYLEEDDIVRFEDDFGRVTPSSPA